jgi:hypothetical protein
MLDGVFVTISMGDSVKHYLLNTSENDRELPALEFALLERIVRLKKVQDAVLAS